MTLLIAEKDCETKLPVGTARSAPETPVVNETTARAVTLLDVTCMPIETAPGSDCLIAAQARPQRPVRNTHNNKSITVVVMTT